MLTLSHRGYWKTAAEKNTPVAFERSFALGFGTETDIRDLAGTLVVSHDPPVADALSAEALFTIHQQTGPHVPLALNVKADGLPRLLLPLIERFAVADWFVFDMSVPDALGWLKAGAPTFTRHSDHEPHPPYYDRAAGVWLDAFLGDWWNADVVRRHLDAGKRVCIVSPELHGRDPRAVWDLLAAAEDLRANPHAMLCTDRPEEAKEVCGGEIRAVIFDMDGVLIDAREWHYEALNRALGLFGHTISRMDHLTTFDGLPTRKKLEMLSLDRGLPRGLHSFLNELKQVYTTELVHLRCKPAFAHEYALSKLKGMGYKLAVASNSVRGSVELMMEKSHLRPYLDVLVSNQDVVKPKPDPEMYLAAVSRLGFTPAECLVVEDNPNGIRAAEAAGCHVMVVHGVEDVHLAAVLGSIQRVEGGAA